MEEEESKVTDQKEYNHEFIKDLEVSYLDEEEHTGGTLVKCTHYAHYKCLNNYLTSNESDRRKSEIRKTIGLNFNTFQCPLCKHISNVLFPGDTLGGYAFNKLDRPDFDQVKLFHFFTNMVSKIVRC